MHTKVKIFNDCDYNRLERLVNNFTSECYANSYKIIDIKYQVAIAHYRENHYSAMIIYTCSE